MWLLAAAGGGERGWQRAAAAICWQHGAACGNTLFSQETCLMSLLEDFPTAFTESNCTHNFFKWLKNALAESCKICSVTPLPIAAQAPRGMICSSGRPLSWGRKAARITAECFFSQFSSPLTVRRTPIPQPFIIRAISLLSDSAIRRSVQAP